ncbi:MAG: hypothetical protein LBT59_22805 [Clostridiales bacterium]|jgi:hypothetical protein|nr:hypothetical protein [Clostridiales bacterium]
MLKSKILRYIYLLPLLLMIALSFFFVTLHGLFYDSRFKTAFRSVKGEVNLMSELTDGFIAQDNDWIEEYAYYKRHLEISVETMISNQSADLAVLYDGSLNRLSPQTELKFDPLKNLTISRFISTGRSGDTEILVDGETMKVHYRWIPSDSALKNRFLVVVGVSESAIGDSVADGVFMAGIFIVMLTSILDFVLVNQITTNLKKDDKTDPPTRTEDAT